MTTQFLGTAPGERLPAGSRLRAVFQVNGFGEAMAGLNPWGNSTDVLNDAATAIIEAVPTRGIGYVINVPPAIAPGDLGVVLDIRLQSDGNGLLASEVASSLDDMSQRLDLVRLGPIPTGETAAMALKSRDSQTTVANTAAAASLPSGVLSNAADSVGAGAKNLVTAIKWGGIILLIGVAFWAWRTYGPRS